MSVSEIFLDASWSLQFIPGTRDQIEKVDSSSDHTINTNDFSREIQDSSEECYQYLLSRGRAALQDDLNDESVKTGQLRECVISRILPRRLAHELASKNVPIGLLIETRYQKTTYQVILLTQRNSNIAKHTIAVVLYKASQNHIKHMKNWLELRFLIQSALPLQIPSQLLLQMCSGYLTSLESCWTPHAGYEDALRAATLKQVVGNLKLTLSFSSSSDINSKLRTIDLDIPAETVNVLLDKARQRSVHESAADGLFLDELAKSIHEKTGLKLPLLGSSTQSTQAITRTDNGQVVDTEQAALPLAEPPLRVTKITCAAFAISVDGRIKLASKPIENAEITGFDEEGIRAAYQLLLDMIRDEAERRSVGS